MEIGEQQYFTPNTVTPPPQPWWRKRQVVVRGLVGIVGIVVVGCVVVFAANTLRQRADSPDSAVLDRISAALADCAQSDDVASCEQKIRTDMAREAATPLGCTDLSADLQTNCIMLIAQDEADVRICVALPDDMQSTCEDGIRLNLAVEADDYGACAAITDSTTRATCQSRLRSTVLANGTCVDNGIAPEECVQAAALQDIVASGSYGDCTTLTGEAVVKCQEIFSGLDQDKDGLSAKREFELGTDPRNSDTDGDSYNDAEEVKTGNNPIQ